MCVWEMRGDHHVQLGEVTFYNDILRCFITQISYTEVACCEVTGPCQMRLCLGTRTPGVWRTTETFY